MAATATSLPQFKYIPQSTPLAIYDPTEFIIPIENMFLSLATFKACLKSAVSPD